MKNRSLLENLNWNLYPLRAQISSDRIVCVFAWVLPEVFAEFRKGVPKIVRRTRDSVFGRTVLGVPGWLSFALSFSLPFHPYIYNPAVLQRHVCITRSTASLPAGVVCGKALLAPRVPQLNSQAFRLIYRPEVEATLPCALRLALPPPPSPRLKVRQVIGNVLRTLRFFYVSPVDNITCPFLAQMRIFVSL